MRILADENIPGSVVKTLRGDGHDVVWILDIAAGSGDNRVFDIAISQTRILLTQDKDFAARAARRTNPGLDGLILLRPDGIGAIEIANFVTRTINSRDDWRGQFAILKQNSIRLRKLA